MSIIGFASAKHSPGVTTSVLALGLAIAEQRSVLAFEADPSGGDLGAMCGLTLERGLLSSLATMRNGASANLDSHVQRHGPLNVLVGPSSISQMENVLQATGRSALEAATSSFDETLVDFGRLTASPPNLLSLCERLILVVRPTLMSVEHARSRLSDLGSETNVQLLVVGSQPYGPTEVAEALGRPLLGHLPLSPRDVELLTNNPKSKSAPRSGLMRAARTIADRLQTSSKATRRFAPNRKAQQVAS
jgi:MinD-like ATPase involved in chromosome partitioning or flagellar assembly